MGCAIKLLLVSSMSVEVSNPSKQNLAVKEGQVLNLHSSSFEKCSCNIISLVLAASLNSKAKPLLNRAIQIASHTEPRILVSVSRGKGRNRGCGLMSLPIDTLTGGM